jgi:plasmid stabilization system protein ParE
MKSARTLSAGIAGRFGTPTLLPAAKAALAWWWRGLMLGREGASKDAEILATVEDGHVVVRAPRQRRGASWPRRARAAAPPIAFLPLEPADATGMAASVTPATVTRTAYPTFSDLRRLARRRPVVLVVPPSAVLVRPLELPAAAARSLASAVRFGLPQWTPFAADDVHHAARHVARSAGDAEKVIAELRLVPKSVVARALATLADAGISADVVRLGDGFDVALDGRKAARARRGLMAEVALALLAVGLAGVLCAVLSDRLAALQAALTAKLAEEVRMVQGAEALRAEIVALEGRDARLAAQRAAAPPLVEIAASLATALPEDVEAISFSWGERGGRLLLVGPADSLDQARQTIEAAAASDAPVQFVGSEPAGEDGEGRARVEWRLARSETAP